MTRVALLPSAYLPSLGGVEELTRHLALALRAGGDEVEVWTGTDREEEPPRAERLDGIVVRRLPFPLPAARPAAVGRFALRLPAAVRAFREAVRQFRPDVLHVQCFGPNGVYATYMADRVGVPLVITLQGETVMDDLDIFEHSRVSRTSLRRGLRRARVVTACSAFTLADAERRFGLQPGRGSVVFNGVDLATATATATATTSTAAATATGTASAAATGPGKAARPPAVGTGPYVLALGRVVEKKGFDLLLRAYAQVPDGYGVGLVIGGDGAARPGLESLAGELGLGGRVRFAGRLPRDEVAAAMANAEILVVPSRLEPFGIVVLEGWRAGTAVIATARGGPPEFVTDGVDGRVVDPFDTAALAEALDALLGDDEARRAMGAAGRRAVEPFDWRHITDTYRDCYRRALSPAGDGAADAGPGSDWPVRGGSGA